MAVEQKLFIGFLLTSEIKAHLKRSRLLKKEKALGQSKWDQSYHDEKEYIGFQRALPETVKSIKMLEEALRSQLQFYCPKLRLNNHLIYLFLEQVLS